jgi:nucleotide-binding universal stress UspA family protein
MGIENAAHFAHRAGAELLVLHVGTNVAGKPSPAPGTLAAPKYVDQWHHEMAWWAQEFLGRLEALCHAPAAVNLQLFMAAGKPNAEILRFAREHAINLVVMTWQGWWDPEHAQTLKEVIRESTCPVLVLRASPSGA